MVVWAVSGGRRISIYSAHMGRGARILLLEGGHDGMEVGRLGWDGGGAPLGVFTFLSAKQVRRRNIYRWAPVTTCAPPLVRPSVTREMTRRSNADGWLSIFQSERENGKERKEESQIQLLESIFRGAGVRLRLCPLR